jgi:hypothetical protein
MKAVRDKEVKLKDLEKLLIRKFPPESVNK